MSQAAWNKRDDDDGDDNNRQDSIHNLLPPPLDSIQYIRPGHCIVN